MIQIRIEQEGDLPGIRHVNQLAFGREVEAELVDNLRQAGAAILSLVAEEEGEIVGHILFSPVLLEADGGDLSIPGLAPLAVLPSHQRQGIGTRLVRESLARLKVLGHEAVIVVGHPSYYPRFGFLPASRFGLCCVYKDAGDAFMALELVPGSLVGRAGLVRFRPEFPAA